MSDPANPFQKWLEITDPNPDHYQLLGLSRDETDKRAITDAAKRAVARMGEQPAADDEEAWKFVRRQIKLAYKCLIDPDARRDYQNQLATSSTGPDRSSADADQPGDDDQDSFTVDQDEDDEQETDASLDTVVDELRAEMAGSSPISKPKTALPMAEVVDEPPVAIPPPDPTPRQPPPTESVQVDTQTQVKRQRKTLKRLISTVLMSIVVIALVGGGIYWIVVQQTTNSAGKKNEDETDRAQSDKKANQSTDPRPAQEGSDDVSKLNNSDAIDAALKEQPKSPADGQNQEVPERPSSNKPHSNISAPPPNGNAENANSNVEESEGTSGSNVLKANWGNTGTPNAIENLLLARYFDEAWKGIMRRDREWTSQQLERARQVTMTREHQRAWELLETVSRRYEDFWFRVRLKGRQLPAVEQFEINGQTISITESKPDELVYRVAGERIALAYDRLPTLIALAIASKDLEEDAMEVHWDRALAYAIAAKRNAFLLDEAMRVLDEAELADANVSYCREFLDNDWQGWDWFDQAVQRPSARDISLAQNDLAAELPTTSELRRLIPEQAIATTDRLVELAIKDADPARRFVCFQAALQAARASNDAFKTIEVLDLRSKLFVGEDWLTEYLAQLKPSRPGDLPDDDVRRLMVVYFEIYQRCLDEANEQAAGQAMEQASGLAQAKQLDNWLDKIKRTLGQSEDAAFSL